MSEKVLFLSSTKVSSRSGIVRYKINRFSSNIWFSSHSVSMTVEEIFLHTAYTTKVVVLPYRLGFSQNSSAFVISFQLYASLSYVVLSETSIVKFGNSWDEIIHLSLPFYLNWKYSTTIRWDVRSISIIKYFALEFLFFGIFAGLSPITASQCAFLQTLVAPYF